MAKNLNSDGFARELKKKEFRVTIFGSARVDKKDPAYQYTYELAKHLGERGFDIVTGGGPGIMEAASLGHKEGRKFSPNQNAHAIGLGISLPKEQKINKGINIAGEFHRFSRRLDEFMLLSNVFVVAPGGIGTLLELFYTWQLMQVRHICHIPIILVGDMWKRLIRWLKKDPLRKEFFDRKDLDLLIPVDSLQDALKVIDEAYASFQLGEEKCVNARWYKKRIKRI